MTTVRGEEVFPATDTQSTCHLEWANIFLYFRLSSPCTTHLRPCRTQHRLHKAHHKSCTTHLRPCKSHHRPHTIDPTIITISGLQDTRHHYKITKAFFLNIYIYRSHFLMQLIFRSQYLLQTSGYISKIGCNFCISQAMHLTCFITYHK